MMRALSSLWTNLLPRLRKDRRGHFGTATAILILPLMATAGLAVDLSFAFSARESLQAAADAAVLNAVRSAAREEVEKSVADPARAYARLGTETRRVFRDSIPKSIGRITQFSVVPVFRYANDILQVDLSYHGQIETHFLKVIGYDTISLTGKASAKSDSFQYVQFHMMLDNSPAMGMDAFPPPVDDPGGTALEHTVKVVEFGSLETCMFSCHMPDIYNSSEGNFAALMRSDGKTLRMDVAKAAVRGLGAVIEQERVRANQFRMALYSFGDYQGNVAARPYVSIGGMTQDMNLFRSQVDAQDVIRTATGSPLAATDYPGLARRFNQNLPTSQTGNSVGKPRLVLMMLIGGLADPTIPGVCSHPLTADPQGLCMAPMDLADCEALKNRGIDIAIAQMEYKAPKAVRHFGSPAAVPDPISPNLEACASDDFYIKSNPATLGSDLKDLFRRVIHRPRLLG